MAGPAEQRPLNERNVVDSRTARLPRPHRTRRQSFLGDTQHINRENAAVGDERDTERVGEDTGEGGHAYEQVIVIFCRDASVGL